MNNQDRSALDDDRVGRLLLKLSIPAFFGMFVTTIYNVVDTIFIGHYVGPLGIAGLSVVFPLQMLSLGIGQMTGIGGASLISRLIGAGNIPRAERALGNGITATIVLSAIMMIVGLANPDFWLRLMGSSETILPYARDYMTIILTGIVFQTLAMAFNGLIRAEGNARVPMIGMIIGAVLNIILDAIFIIPMGMGIRGAALATVISQLISVIYFFMSYYYTGKSFLKIHPRNLIPELGILKQILAIGISAFAMTAAGSLSAVFAIRALGTFGGDLAVSAFGIFNRVMMFILMPGLTIGQGLQPIVGFNYGAKHYDRALKAIKLAMAAATACSVLAFIALFFLPEPIIRIFTTDVELIALASYAIKRAVLAVYVVGFFLVGSTIFQAIGKAVQSFVCAIARPVLFLIPLIFILTPFLQLDGVWFAFPLTDVFTFLLVLVLFIYQIRDFRKKDALAREAAIGVRPN